MNSCKVLFPLEVISVNYFYFSVVSHKFYDLLPLNNAHASLVSLQMSFCARVLLELFNAGGASVLKLASVAVAFVFQFVHLFISCCFVYIECFCWDLALESCRLTKTVGQCYNRTGIREETSKMFILARIHEFPSGTISRLYRSSISSFGQN